MTPQSIEQNKLSNKQNDYYIPNNEAETLDKNKGKSLEKVEEQNIV